MDPYLEVSDLRVRCRKFFTEVGMGLAIFFCIGCLTIDLPEDLPYFRDMLLNIYNVEIQNYCHVQPKPVGPRAGGDCDF